MNSIHTLVAETAHHWELLEDLAGDVVFTSPSVLALTGYPPEFFQGRPDALRQLVHPEHRDDFDAFERRMRNGGGKDGGCLELKIMTRAGESRWVACNTKSVPGPGRTLLVRSSLRDITHSKQKDLALEQARLTDPITGLPNRSACLERIHDLLELQRSGLRCSVVAMDIDRLMKVNETLGPSFGDELLRVAAERLSSTVTAPSQVYRVSGDGFAVILMDMSPREVIAYVKRAQSLLGEPFDLRDHEVSVTASAGIVMSPERYERPEHLLRNAIIALRRAKENRRHRYKVFQTKLFEETLRQSEIEIDLHGALRNEEFFVVYQPIVCLETQRLTSIEALVRWQHPRHGLMRPDEFLPVAEATDFIVPLGEWVLRQGCRDMVNLLAEMPELGDITLSVNISARQLAQHDIAKIVAAALRDSGLEPSRLKLELTETVAMENPALTCSRLRAIKALGVRISIDDFGTGYSSMSSLQSFPIDTIKVDKSFVSRMDKSPDQRKIVRSVITLAHSLNLDVVAEGIEMREQWSMLKMLDCQGGQGFLISRPVRVGEIMELARRPEGLRKSA